MVTEVGHSVRTRGHGLSLERVELRKLRRTHFDRHHALEVALHVELVDDQGLVSYRACPHSTAVAAPTPDYHRPLSSRLDQNLLSTVGDPTSGSFDPQLTRRRDRIDPFESERSESCRRICRFRRRPADPDPDQPTRSRFHSHVSGGPDCPSNLVSRGGSVCRIAPRSDLPPSRAGCSDPQLQRPPHPFGATRVGQAVRPSGLRHLDHTGRSLKQHANERRVGVPVRHDRGSRYRGHRSWHYRQRSRRRGWQRRWRKGRRRRWSWGSGRRCAGTSGDQQHEPESVSKPHRCRPPSREARRSAR